MAPRVFWALCFKCLSSLPKPFQEVVMSSLLLMKGWKSWDSEKAINTPKDTLLLSVSEGIWTVYKKPSHPETPLLVLLTPVSVKKLAAWAPLQAARAWLKRQLWVELLCFLPKIQTREPATQRFRLPALQNSVSKTSVPPDPANALCVDINPGQANQVPWRIQTVMFMLPDAQLTMASTVKAT